MEHFFEFVHKHWLLWVGLVLVIILIVIEELRTHQHRGIKLSPQELTHKINRDEAVVIDVRDKDLYTQGHIVGSVHIPQADLLAKPEQLKNYQNKTIVLVCNEGRASLSLAAQLRKQGVQALVLADGLNNWRKAGLPLTKGKDNG